MSPEDIKALRAELGCTARDLGAALEVAQDEVLAWERGDLFPTKRLVDRMQELKRKGKSALPPKKKRGAPATPNQVLSSPEFWTLFRKLVAHDELRAAALKLSEKFDDPAGSS